MLQDFLVAAIVVIAVAYAAWALVPGTTRLGLARRLGTWGRAPGRHKWIARATGIIERAAGRRHGDCAGCSADQPEIPRPGERPNR